MSTINESYKEYYRVIEEAQSLGRVKIKDRGCEDYEYFESHHIIPKSLGGSDSYRNLVLLTPEEHYICHSLLPDFCEGEAKVKMMYAWNRCNNSKNIEGLEIIGPVEYGRLKRDFANSASENRLAFARTEEGKENYIKLSKLGKAFAQTEAGKERYKKSGEKNSLTKKAFAQTEEGKKRYKDSGKKGSLSKQLFAETEEGKELFIQVGKKLSKAVTQFDLNWKFIGWYDGQKIAAKELGYPNSSGISHSVNGVKPHYKKCHWRNSSNLADQWEEAPKCLIRQTGF